MTAQEDAQWILTAYMFTRGSRDAELPEYLRDLGAVELTAEGVNKRMCDLAAGAVRALSAVGTVARLHGLDLDELLRETLSRLDELDRDEQGVIE